MINKQAVESLEEKLSPEFKGLMGRLQAEQKIVAALLCGSRSQRTARSYSDFDIFLITNGYNKGNVQVVHYKVGQKRLDVMLYEYGTILRENEFDVRLLSVLLRNALPLFSRNERLVEQLGKYIRNTLHHQTGELERQSIWYNFIWNTGKAKSYQSSNPELAEAIVMETYYFIGLFYAKLHGQEIYSFAESLNFMQQMSPNFWRKYKSALTQQDRIKAVTNLLRELPSADFYLSHSSYVELDSFISPLTVVPPSSDRHIAFQKSMDRLILGL